jgi:hypothetical protein
MKFSKFRVFGGEVGEGVNDALRRDVDEDVGVANQLKLKRFFSFSSHMMPRHSV